MTPCCVCGDPASSFTSFILTDAATTNGFCSQHTWMAEFTQNIPDTLLPSLRSIAQQTELSVEAVLFIAHTFRGHGVLCRNAAGCCRAIWRSAHDIADQSAADLLRRLGIVSGRQIGPVLRPFLDAGIVRLAEGERLEDFAGFESIGELADSMTGPRPAVGGGTDMVLFPSAPFARHGEVETNCVASSEQQRSGLFDGKRPEIAAAILIAVVGLFLGLVNWIGKARNVFLVNGTSRPYTVAIEGREYSLAPGVATPIRIAAGEVEVAFPDPNLGLAPVRCKIESSSHHTYVINPDRAAVMLQQQSWYGEAPPPCGPSHIRAGQVFYDLPPLDYEFKDFPKTIRVPRNHAVRKTGIGLFKHMPPERRLVFLLERIPANEHFDFCERLLHLDPGDNLPLSWLAGKFPQERTLEFLKGHLDWHRAYQALMERAHPDTDLRPRYQKLLADSQGHAEAAYLLARIEPDPDKADQLLRQAAAGKPPSGQAMVSLGSKALSQGCFAEAVVWYEKAMPLVPDKSSVRPPYHDAFLANRDYDRLLGELESQMQGSRKSIRVLTEISRVQAIKGDKEKARTTLAEAVQLNPENARQAFKTALDARLCCWESDRDGYLKEADAVGRLSFESAFLRGNLEQAAGFVRQFGAGVEHALLYLAATRSGAKELALAQWQTLAERLAKGSREERLLADVLQGRKPITEYPPQNILLDPQSKRVYLAVIAQRFPEQAKETIPLAEKLDFHRDAISLCLQKVLAEGLR
jgi:tetratricopeptide (TPR) repeat protein